MKQTFVKAYVRDTNTIIEQLWPPSLKVACEKYLEKKYDFGEQIIFYSVDGVIQIWEDKQVTQQLMDYLLVRNEQEDFFPSLMTEYENLLVEIESFWFKGTLATLDELKSFLKLIKKAMPVFNIMYYTSLDERTPKKALEIALALRDKDKFFDESEGVVRKTLSSLFPHLKNQENMVFINELDKLPSQEEMNKRQEGFVIVGQQQPIIKSLESFAQNNKEFSFIFEKSTENKLKGKCAFKGKVQGRVRIMNKKQLINTIQEGEILVSAMTTPDFVPAMKKAAAIVTDEGGITSHAAIIARELKKPCVIGTKFASEILKDGDLVEVDANTGVVRKL